MAYHFRAKAGLNNVHLDTKVARATQVDSSRGKGIGFLGRLMQRRDGRNAPTSDTVWDAQYDVIVDWASATTPHRSG